MPLRHSFARCAVTLLVAASTAAPAPAATACTAITVFAWGTRAFGVADVVTLAGRRIFAVDHFDAATVVKRCHIRVMR